MRHHRYLALIAGMVCVQAGTFDELHQAIILRNRRSGFRTDFETIDTWNEPGRIVEKHGLYVWKPTQ